MELAYEARVGWADAEPNPNMMMCMMLGSGFASAQPTVALGWLEFLAISEAAATLPV